MNWLWYIPIACAAWSVGWLLFFYFVIEAKHDASGDGGLALGVTAYSYIRERDAKAKIHETMIEAWSKEPDPVRRKALYDEICRFEKNWNT